MSSKYLLSMLFAVILMIMLSGCGSDDAVPLQPEPEPAPEAAPEVDDTPAPEPVAPEEPSEEQDGESIVVQADIPQDDEQEAAEMKMSPMLEELTEKSSKVKDYGFHYSPMDDPKGPVYFIKGDDMKITLLDLEKVEDDVYVDTVYLNMTDRTAVGYCENWKLTTCDDPNEPVELDFYLYEIKTPIDWVKSLDNGEFISSETFEQRKVRVVEYMSGENKGLMWIDDHYGLAWQVELWDGETLLERHTYSDMSFNSALKKSATHEFILEGD